MPVPGSASPTPSPVITEEELVLKGKLSIHLYFGYQILCLLKDLTLLSFSCLSAVSPSKPGLSHWHSYIGRLYLANGLLKAVTLWLAPHVGAALASCHSLTLQSLLTELQVGLCMHHSPNSVDM